MGIVAFAASPAPGVELPAADTLVIHRRPSPRSPVVARLILQMPEPFVWGYALEIAEDGVHGNALEFDYEVLGLPVDTGGPAFDYRLEPLEVDGRWMKVRVVTPDDACSAEPIEPRERTAWIQYLDKRRRRRRRPAIIAESPAKP